MNRFCHYYCKIEQNTCKFLTLLFRHIWVSGLTDILLLPRQLLNHAFFTNTIFLSTLSNIFSQPLVSSTFYLNPLKSPKLLTNLIRSFLHPSHPLQQPCCLLVIDPFLPNWACARWRLARHRTTDA